MQWPVETEIWHFLRTETGEIYIKGPENGEKSSRRRWKYIELVRRIITKLFVISLHRTQYFCNHPTKLGILHLGLVKLVEGDDLVLFIMLSFKFSL